MFIMKQLTSSIEKAQSFKINIPDLFVSIKLINDFWVGNIKFFFGLVYLLGTFATCSLMLLYDSDVFWLE